MNKVFIIIIFLISGTANSQVTKDDFENAYPEVKELTIKSNKLEMGYEDQYFRESDFIAYKVNGIYIVYESEKWFIPYKRIQSIGSIGALGLQINLKG